MRWLIIVGIVASVGASTGSARAQKSDPKNGDDLGTTQKAWMYSAPLRWSVMAGAPWSGPMFSPCEEQAVSRGNATQAFGANPYFSAWKLAPSLYLVGFARHGCPIDAGAGGGLVYAVPLPSNLFLTASTGLYHLPRNGASRPVTMGDARLDLGWQPAPGRTVTLGIGLRGVSVGSSF
jgi:hypothetical protein